MTLTTSRIGLIGRINIGQRIGKNSYYNVSNLHQQQTFSSVKAKVQTISSDRKNIPFTDSFNRSHNYLRMSLTERCNLRCTYCMPEEGVPLTPTNLLPTLEERKRILSLFIRSGGVDKIRFTGGEPTISKQLPLLIKHVHDTGLVKTIGITTNGIVLKSQLDSLIAQGLTSVNISLDTLDADKFATITRRDKKGFLKVLSSIYYAVSKLNRNDNDNDNYNSNIKTNNVASDDSDGQNGPGLKSVKINCVMMRGFNDSEFVKFVQLTKDMPIDVRFIELMPFVGNAWDDNKLVTYMEVLDLLNQQGMNLEKIQKSHASNARISSTTNNNDLKNEIEIDPHDTTKWYRVPNWKGRVGFITSMSSHFCGSCNRLRITADGKLKLCLFSGGGDGGDGSSDGLDLVSLLRSNNNSSYTSDNSNKTNDNDRENENDNEINTEVENENENEMLINKIKSVVKLKKFSLGGYNSPIELAQATANSNGNNESNSNGELEGKGKGKGNSHRPMILIGG